MLLKDKIAFITGGSQGIGKACALVLAEAGADVAVGGRNLEKLNQVVEEIRGLGRRAFAIQDRKSTRLNSSHIQKSRMPSSA